MIKKIIKLFSVILIAIFIEVFIINISSVVTFFNTETIENQIYTLDKMTLINWNKDGEEYVSEVDPMLIIHNIKGSTKIVSITVKTTENIPYIDMFFSKGSASFNSKNMIRNNTPRYQADGGMVWEFEIDKNIDNLRVDIGDERGTRISECKIIINPLNFDFSLARIITIILLFYISKFLFSLQNSPKYNITGEE